MESLHTEAEGRLSRVRRVNRIEEQCATDDCWGRIVYLITRRLWRWGMVEQFIKL